MTEPKRAPNAESCAEGSSVLHYPKHSCIQQLLLSCLSCLSSLLGEDQDSSYESCYFYSGLFLQHNTTNKKQEGQSDAQSTNWSLHCIVLELHLFFSHPADKYSAYSPENTQTEMSELQSVPAGAMLEDKSLIM